MNYLIFPLIGSFIIFLYAVFLLTKDDFVILRSNTPMEKIFNSAFLTSIFGLFFARLLYVLFNPKPIFHSLLGFILFPYFPGLSLIGGIMGAFGFAYLFFKSRNMPIFRLLDFYSMGFLCAFPVALAGIILITHSFNLYFLLGLIFFLIYFSLFAKFAFGPAIGSKIKDGVLFYLFLFSFSASYIIERIFLAKFKFNIDSENLISLMLFLVSGVFLIYKERILSFLLEKWKNRK